MGPMREGSLKPAARPVMTNKNVADYNGALMAEVARSERKINVWRFVNESNIIDDGMHLDVPTLEYTTKVEHLAGWKHESGLRPLFVPGAAEGALQDEVWDT